MRVCRLSNGIHNEARNGRNKNGSETILTSVSVRIYESEQSSTAKKKRYNLNQFSTVRYILQLLSLSLMRVLFNKLPIRLSAVIHRTFNSVIPDNDLSRFNANTNTKHSIDKEEKLHIRKHSSVWIPNFPVSLSPFHGIDESHASYFHGHKVSLPKHTFFLSS